MEPPSEVVVFEVAEVGHAVSEEDYEAARGPLITELLALQRALADRAAFPVIVVLAGVDAAGKSESANQIARWLDSRYVTVRAYDAPSEEERQRPTMWRFWRDLPPRGRVGVVLSSWYSEPVLDHVYERADRAALDAHLDRVVAFERLLAEDGAVLVKIWLHITARTQRKRLDKLAADPLTAWRVGRTERQNLKRHDAFVAAAEAVIHRTSGGHAPWTIVEGTDRRYRELRVATLLRDALRRALDRPQPVAPSPMALPPAQRTVLDAVDLGARLDKDMYERALREEGERVARLVREARERGVGVVLVFEGWDAAGKGGAIKRLVDFLDIRDVSVHPIAAPTPDERRQPWLWRFWTRLERAGRVTIFDRSWYGRVLVERVEGFCDEAAWRRAFAEIRQFEDELVQDGRVLVKLWLHVSGDEQARRFEERRDDPTRQHKLTDEDWRNREKRPAYEVAVHDMVERTSTRRAPWTLVPADDKRHARVAVLRAVAAALSERLTR